MNVVAEQCCCGVHARIILLNMLHYNLAYSLITLLDIQTSYQGSGNRL